MLCVVRTHFVPSHFKKLRYLEQILRSGELGSNDERSRSRLETFDRFGSPVQGTRSYIFDWPELRPRANAFRSPKFRCAVNITKLQKLGLSTRFTGGA